MKGPCRVFAAIFVLAVSGSAADAGSGLFDFLFGSSSPSRGDGYVPQPSADEVERKDEDKTAREEARRAAVKRQATVQTPADEPGRDLLLNRQLAEVAGDRGPEAAFMLDPTLRKGDIVVTRAGLQVFQGTQAKFHMPNQFLPLARSALRNRTDLKLLQQAGRFNMPPAATPSSDSLRPLTIQRSVQRATKFEDPNLIKMAIGHDSLMTSSPKWAAFLSSEN
jgi:hypothetical protein